MGRYRSNGRKTKDGKDDIGGRGKKVIVKTRKKSERILKKKLGTRVEGNNGEGHTIDKPMELE